LNFSVTFLGSPGLNHFCLQNCLNSSWQRLNKVLETFLRDFASYWHDSITQLRFVSWALSCWKYSH